MAEFGPEEIAGMVNGFKTARVLLSAVELGLFDALALAGGSSREVAAACETDVRATNRVLNVLVSLGLLRQEEGRFLHTESSRRFLRKDSPEYLAKLDHSLHLWNSWNTLTQAVRLGGRVETGSPRRREPELTRSFIAAMHYYGLERARAVVDSLDLSGVSSVLDIGGGSGAYSIAFMRAIGPAGRATIFDLPEVVPLASDYVAEAGLSGRIALVAGDYLSDELPAGHDLAFLSAVIHINSPRENEDLVRRTAAGLNPGGQLVVRDFFVDEDRCGPLMATLFSLNMLVNTRRGDSYAESEMRRWFAAAGLVDVRRIHMGEGAGMLVGRRQGSPG